MKKGFPKTLGIFLLKLVGTILFLWWAFSRIEDKSTLADNFRQAVRSPFWVCFGLSMALFSLLANAFRWQFLLRAQEINQPFGYVFRLTLYGAFFNIVSLGGAAGDAAKIVLLIRREPEKRVGVAMSVMVDHVIGFVSGSIIFLLFTWGLGTISMATGETARNTFVAATWLQVGGLVGIALSVFSCTPRMLSFGRRKLPLITNNRWVDKITTVLDLYRTRWLHCIWSLLASFALAGTYYLTFFAGLRSLGTEVAASTVMAVMPVVDVVAALPISISGLGVRERTFEFMLGQLTGIPPSAAVSASLIGFLFNIFWGLVGGLAIVTARHNNKSTSEDV